MANVLILLQPHVDPLTLDGQRSSMYHHIQLFHMLHLVLEECLEIILFGLELCSYITLCQGGQIRHIYM
jgi:hypothetical protein